MIDWHFSYLRVILLFEYLCFRLASDGLFGLGWRYVIHHVGPLIAYERISLRTGKSDDSPNLLLESADSSLVSSLVSFDDEFSQFRDGPHFSFTFLGVRTIAYPLEGAAGEVV